VWLPTREGPIAAWARLMEAAPRPDKSEYVLQYNRQVARRGRIQFSATPVPHRFFALFDMACVSFALYGDWFLPEHRRRPLALCTLAAANSLVTRETRVWRLDGRDIRPAPAIGTEALLPPRLQRRIRRYESRGHVFSQLDLDVSPDYGAAGELLDELSLANYYDDTDFRNGLNYLLAGRCVEQHDRHYWRNILLHLRKLVQK
jgi:hypothetical protein